MFNNNTNNNNNNNIIVNGHRWFETRTYIIHRNSELKHIADWLEEDGNDIDNREESEYEEKYKQITSDRG